MIRQVIIENLLIVWKYFVYSLFNHMTPIFGCFFIYLFVLWESKIQTNEIPNIQK